MLRVATFAPALITTLSAPLPVSTDLTLPCDIVMSSLLSVPVTVTVVASTAVSSALSLPRFLLFKVKVPCLKFVMFSLWPVEPAAIFRLLRLILSLVAVPLPFISNSVMSYSPVPSFQAFSFSLPRVIFLPVISLDWILPLPVIVWILVNFVVLRSTTPFSSFRVLVPPPPFRFLITAPAVIAMISSPSPASRSFILAPAATEIVSAPAPAFRVSTSPAVTEILSSPSPAFRVFTLPLTLIVSLPVPVVSVLTSPLTLTLSSPAPAVRVFTLPATVTVFAPLFRFRVFTLAAEPIVTLSLPSLESKLVTLPLSRVITSLPAVPVMVTFVASVFAASSELPRASLFSLIEEFLTFVMFSS